jgi:hypothetical protein
MARVANRCVNWCCLMVLAGSLPVAMGDELVSIEPQSDGHIVKIRGEEFTVLHHGPSLPKPYFWPVRGPGGAILTRPIDPVEKDHPHHRGIWLAVDEVNEIKFWAERGQIATREIKVVSGNPGLIHLKNEWMGPDAKPALLERTTISIYPNRLVTYDVELSPFEGRSVRFDDTKEGFFGIRIAQSMREKEGGVVVNSNGKKTTLECWGQPAKWVDYTGPVDGKDYGVALMDHPGNFRPSRYHVRDYGLFSMSPFGEGAYQNDATKAQPVTLDATTPSLRIRYGLYVHSGSAKDGNVAATYDQFLQVTR